MAVNEKIPPQSIEAEMSVLGAALFEPDAIFRLIEVLKPEYFYSETHQKIYSAMYELFDQGKPVDLITVTEKLKENDILESLGGADYLSELTTAVSTAAHIMQHAEIIKEKYYLRTLISVATTIIESAYDQSGDAKEILDQAEQMIFQVSGEDVDGGISTMKDLMHITIDKIENLYRRKELVTGLATGFDKIDEMTSGLHKSDLIILAARPSMGKSAFALNICEYVALKLKKAVAFFSLEMSKEQLSQRLLCSVAKFNAQSLRTGFFSKKDFPRLLSAAGKIAESDILIDDTPGMSISSIRAKARRYKAKYNIELIVIDYLQLMHSTSHRENRQQEISEISRRLKALAREIDVPVIALSQLSRAVESRPDKRPQLSDLRESGSIEQDADVVMLMMREEYYNPTEENKGKAEIIIAKQRNGPVGTAHLVFRKEVTRFENLSMREYDNGYN